MADAKEDEVVDPCATMGRDQRWALVWFAIVVLGGAYLTYFLAGIDSGMWNTNAQYIEMGPYRQNRYAATAIGSEDNDPRAFGGYSSAAGRSSR